VRRDASVADLIAFSLQAFLWHSIAALRSALVASFSSLLETRAFLRASTRALAVAAFLLSAALLFSTRRRCSLARLIARCFSSGLHGARVALSFADVGFGA
jgi:hypothetical protein